MIARTAAIAALLLAAVAPAMAQTPPPGNREVYEGVAAEDLGFQIEFADIHKSSGVETNALPFFAVGAESEFISRAA